MSVLLPPKSHECMRNRHYTYQDLEDFMLIWDLPEPSFVVLNKNGCLFSSYWYELGLKVSVGGREKKILYGGYYCMDDLFEHQRSRHFITLTEKLFVEHYEDYVLDKILLGSDNGDN